MAIFSAHVRRGLPRQRFVALVLAVLVSSLNAHAATKDFSLLDYGGAGDGKAMNTDAFRTAIQACSTAGGGRVMVPHGVFLTGPIQLLSHVDLHVEDGAMVLFSKKFDDYPLAVVNYEGKQTVACRSPIWGDDLEDVSITGPGTFDAQGDAWRVVKKNKVSVAEWDGFLKSGGVLGEKETSWYPSAAARDGEADLTKLRASDHSLDVESYRKFRELLRPSLMLLSNCRHLTLDGPTFKNSPNWNLHLLLCDNVSVQHVTIYNPAYAQNGDGIDLDSCSNVVLKDSDINAGDDGICLKSGRDEEGRKRGKPTENVTIDNCTVGHAHGGFVIGSEMSGGVKNVTVTNCTFKGTDNGLRFKSTRGRGGTVENIKVSNITMSDIHDDAITFDMYYMIKGAGNGTPAAEPVNDGTPVFKNFQISNVTCNGAKKAILIRGLPEMAIAGISLTNVTISANEGVSLIDARDIGFENVHVTCKSEPAMETRNLLGFKNENSRIGK